MYPIKDEQERNHFPGTELATSTRPDTSPSTYPSTYKDTTWKEEIEKNFQEWIAQIPEEFPKTQQLSQESEQKIFPSFYQIYEEICVIKNETKKGSRKTSEVFSEFSENLENLNQILEQIKPYLFQSQTDAQNKAKKSLLLSLTELMNRFARMKKVLESPPPKKWIFSRDSKWRSSWNGLQGAFEIIFSHFEELLKKEGISRIQTENQVFNPEVMIAVATKYSPTIPKGYVLEEVSAGYLWKGEILRLAEVTVSQTLTS